MSDILQDIIDAKKKSLEKSKREKPLAKLIAECKKAPNPASFVQSISIPNQLSIIAEMKRRSPSAGAILEEYSPGKIAKIYEKNGAKGISVLTEEIYFQGKPEHLVEVKKSCTLPVLRKDFIFDPYQIYESKILGASAILLIVAILHKQVFSELLKLSKELNLDALVEIHSEYELDVALEQKAGLIGINNRNLKDLSVNVENSFNFIKRIPKDACIVSESGINTPETIERLRLSGFNAALIGESILRSVHMGKKLKTFVEAGRNS